MRKNSPQQRGVQAPSGGSRFLRSLQQSAYEQYLRISQNQQQLLQEAPASSQSPVRQSGQKFHLPKIREEHPSANASVVGYVNLVAQKLQSSPPRVGKKYNHYNSVNTNNNNNNFQQNYMQYLSEPVRAKGSNGSKYPKLAKFAEQSGLTSSQQRALKTIVTKKPQLAASLDLYASRNLASSGGIISLHSNGVMDNGNAQLQETVPRQQIAISGNIGQQRQYSRKAIENHVGNERERLQNDIERIDIARDNLKKTREILLNVQSNNNVLTLSQNVSQLYKERVLAAIEAPHFKYYIARGNNSELVRRVMQKRINWKELPNPFSTVHFRWHPTSRGIKFQHLTLQGSQKKIVNHFEFHRELSTKSGLYRNLKDFCEESGRNLQDITPLTFIINLNDRNWEHDMQQFLEFFVKHQPAALNGGKNRIEIKKKYKTIQADRNYRQNGQLVYTYSEHAQPIMKPSFQSDEQAYVWLLKPVNLNRGRGIEVFSTLEKLEKLINEYTEGLIEKSYKEIGDAMKNSSMVNCNEKNRLIELTAVEDACAPPKADIAEQQQQEAERGGEDEQEGENTGTEQQLPLATGDQQQVEHHATTPCEETLQSRLNQDNSFIIINENSDNIKDARQVVDGNAKQIDAIEDAEEAELDFAKSVAETVAKMPQDVVQLEQNELGSPVSAGIQAQQLGTAGTAGANQKFVLRESQFVIQKYVERPLLINQRKFDIRIWVLLTQSQDAYYFKEGYLRTSSEKFTLKNIENPFIHLTNNAVQQYSKDYGSIEDGNQLSFDNFQEYLNERGHKCNFREQLLPKIEEYIAYSFYSVRHKINKNDRRFCFEIFGYDFIVDSDYNVWLIEVNTNPCIEESSPLLAMYLPRMIDDALRITVDSYFQPVFAPRKDAHARVKSHAGSENRTQRPQTQCKEEKEDLQHTETTKNGDLLLSSTSSGKKKEQVKQQRSSLPQNKLHIDGNNQRVYGGGSSAQQSAKETLNANSKATAENSATEIYGLSPQKNNLTEENHSSIERINEVLTSTKHVSKKQSVNVQRQIHSRDDGEQEEDEIQLQEEQEAAVGQHFTKNTKKSFWPVNGYSDSENMWKHVCNLAAYKKPRKREKGNAQPWQNVL